MWGFGLGVGGRSTKAGPVLLPEVLVIARVVLDVKMTSIKITNTAITTRADTAVAAGQHIP